MIGTLIILPQGATIGGVTTWATQLASVSATKGHLSNLLIHGAITSHSSIALHLHHAVNLHIDEHLPSPMSLAGDLEVLISTYRSHIDRMLLTGASHVVLIPTRDADCFCACARLAAERPRLVRLLGWRHSPMPYEREIFARYSHAMSLVVGVSQWLCDEMARCMPHMRDRIRLVHNAVQVPASFTPRLPLANRPLELIYTGRLDDTFKRTNALPILSDALGARGIGHRLRIVGDGPGEAALRHAALSRPHVLMLGPRAPHEIHGLLATADLFVLPSRVEGLSLSALEAMASGCALAIADTPSGARDLIGDNEAGLIAAVSAHEDESATAQALADAIESIARSGVASIGQRAFGRALRLFSLDRWASIAVDAIEHVDARPGPLAEAIEPFHAHACPASVPHDAAARLDRRLAALRGQRVLIHGCGTHTRALLDVLHAHHDTLVGFADDDSALHGSTLIDLPIVAPADAERLHATDVIFSSWLHEDALWNRRDMYERLGLRAHRLYEPAPLRQPA